MAEPKATYLSGLDLGKLSDYTALAVLQKHTVVQITPPDPFRKPWPGEPSWVAEKPVRKSVNHYYVMRLDRWSNGTPYTDVCEQLVGLFAYPPLAGTTLIPDGTGVGEAVVEIFNKARIDGIIRKGKQRREKLNANVRPITITAGQSFKEHGAGWHVAKRELASVLSTVLGSRRLHVMPGVKMAPVLLKELQEFTVKFTPSGNETYEAMKVTAHDDVVLATAMVLFVGERAMKEAWIR